jgi:hypothetical protein
MSTQNISTPPHFLVIVPGFMGSNLRNRQTGERIWLDLPAMLKNPFTIKDAFNKLAASMAYPNPDLEPDGIVDDVLFLPPLFKQEQYSRLLEFLAGPRLGYLIDPSAARVQGQLAAYTFTYDWRQDNRISARQLGEAIQTWEKRHPGAKAWLIAHSNGVLVSRWYVEKEDGKDHVGRQFLMGGPLDGAPKAMQVLMDGIEIMFRRLVGMVIDVPELTRKLVKTFPAFYQLMPHHNAFLRDEQGKMVDPYADFGWLETDQERQYAADALKFNRDLGVECSVDTLCFVGNKQETTTGGVVHIGAGGRWDRITWDRSEVGDGTVPLKSAAIKSAREILPYQANHGDIYTNADVHEKLEWELCSRYQPGVLAEQVIGKFRVQLDPDQDAYFPGQNIQVIAKVTRIGIGAPVTNARISASLVWRKALPGMPEIVPTGLPQCDLKINPAQPDSYTGVLKAPEREGYYLVRGEVLLKGSQKPLVLEELVLVEQGPDSPPHPVRMRRRALRAIPLPGGEIHGIEMMKEHPTAEVIQNIETVDGEMRGFELIESAKPGPKRILDLSDDHDFSLSMVSEEGILHEAAPVGQHAKPGIAPQENEQSEKSSTASNQWVVAEVMEQLTDRHLDAEPLTPGQAYVLAFSVDIQSAEFAVPLDTQRAFQPEEQDIELSVYLTSPDIAIYTAGLQTLRIPRHGQSKNKARFDIEPLKAGQSDLNAYFFKDNNFIQGMSICLNVANGANKPIAQVEMLNRLPQGALPVKPRDLSLVIKQGSVGLDLTMIGSVVADATLKITDEDLSALFNTLRDALRDVVFMTDAQGNKIFQQKITIPEEMSRSALVSLAAAGYDLFNRLFLTGDVSTQLIGAKLLEMAQKNTLKIQIASDKFLFPWGALYLDDHFEPSDVTWERFLGFKHIIEHVPYQRTIAVTDNIIHSQPSLNVSLNLNQTLDSDSSVKPIARQEQYWDGVVKLAKQRTMNVEVNTRYQSDQLNEALKKAGLPDQILYFFGHAVTAFGDSASDTHLGMTDKDLSLKELCRNHTNLPNAPLVFLNACQSAQLSPIYYGGFMEYFIAKGARGMIGTECEVPTVFAAEWARRFFNRFLAGRQPIGEIFLDLRREFYEVDHNPLGLLYALYCDGDTRIVPGIPIAEDFDGG